jgi:hypothetical protein
MFGYAPVVKDTKRCLFFGANKLISSVLRVPVPFSLELESIHLQPHATPVFSGGKGPVSENS